MEYGAKVNGNFLLLYDPNADMNDVLTTFDGYTSGGVNAGTSAKDTTNTPTSDGAYGNAKTNDPNAGNTTSGNQKDVYKRQVLLQHVVVFHRLK